MWHLSQIIKPFCQIIQIGDRQLAAEIFTKIHRCFVLLPGQPRQKRLVLRKKVDCLTLGQKHDLAGQKAFANHGEHDFGIGAAKLAGNHELPGLALL